MPPRWRYRLERESDLTKSPPPWAVQHPAISPDGETLAFAARINETSDIWLQLDGSNLRPLTSDDGADSWPTWSPDVRAVIFSSVREGRQQTWQVSAAGGTAEKLWLPSGIRLSDYERRSVVWEKPIRHPLAMPVFSPDGRSIRVSARDQDAREGIWILDAATGEGKVAVRFPERFPRGVPRQLGRWRQGARRQSDR